MDYGQLKPLPFRPRPTVLLPSRDELDTLVDTAVLLIGFEDVVLTVRRVTVAACPPKVVVTTSLVSSSATIANK